MTKQTGYSALTGLTKSFKNVLITVGIPAMMVLANHYTEWMPKEWYPVAVPLMSMGSYFVKNYIKNKNV